MADEETLLHTWMAAGDAGDVERFDDCLHTDVIVHAPAGLSTNGIEAEKEVWRAAKAAMPDLRHAIQEVVASGSTIAARVIVTGTLHGTFGGISGSGRSFRIDQALWAHLRDGKIAEAWEIADIAALREQVGAAQA